MIRRDLRTYPDLLGDIVPGVLAPVLALMHNFSMTLHSQVISGRDNVIGIRFTHRFSMEG